MLNQSVTFLGIGDCIGCFGATSAAGKHAASACPKCPVCQTPKPIVGKQAALHGLGVTCQCANPDIYGPNDDCCGTASCRKAWGDPDSCAGSVSPGGGESCDPACWTARAQTASVVISAIEAIACAAAPTASICKKTYAAYKGIPYTEPAWYTTTGGMIGIGAGALLAGVLVYTLVK